MEIPGTEFLTLDWIIRSIRLTTNTHGVFMQPMTKVKQQSKQDHTT